MCRVCYERVGERVDEHVRQGKALKYENEKIFFQKIEFTFFMLHLISFLLPPHISTFPHNIFSSTYFYNAANKWTVIILTSGSWP